MAEGYIKLSRAIMDHPIWDAEPFTKAQAWVHLIMLANHKGNRFFFGNTMVTVERGAFITSEAKLAKQFQWSRTKLRAFLNVLESEKMIEQKKDCKKTYLKLLQYCIWQDGDTEKKPQKDQEKTPEEPLEDTNKNDKNGNKEISELGEGGTAPSAPAPKPSKLSDEQKKDLIQKKQNEFREELKPYVEKYGQDMIDAFYRYWAEPMQRKPNLKWEKEPTWCLSMRLGNWKSIADERAANRRGGGIVRTFNPNSGNGLDDKTNEAIFGNIPGL